MNQQFYRIVSTVGSLIFFLPMAMLLFRRLWTNRTFFWFASYWSLTGAVNVLDFLNGITEQNREFINVLYNMADIPILISIFLVTNEDASKKVYLRISALIYFVIVFAAVYYRGVTSSAGKYPLGLGLIIVLVFVGWVITEFLLRIRHTRTQRTIFLIYVALLFQFGTFVIIYIFDYFVEDSNHQYNFLIYYISSIVALGVASYGLARAFRSKKRQRVDRSPNSSSEPGLL